MARARGGLTKWFKENWVDISRPKTGGGYKPCGRKKAGSNKYPKCVPLAKASKMTKGQTASAVKRKRAAGNPGGKPTNVKTFAANGGFISKERRAGAAVRGFDFKGVF